MRQIGQIKQLQVQRAALKQGAKPYRYYDPAPIMVVEKILLTPGGVIGVTTEGEQIVDVHHAQHPESRYRGENGVSVGFTTHYRTMQERFGGHLVEGCGGENILVATNEEFALAALGTRLAIQAQESGELVYLADVEVAAPCVEFSRFALDEHMPVPAEVVRETLMFLDRGRRGFYATFAGEEPLTLRVGDRVFVEV